MHAVKYVIWDTTIVSGSLPIYSLRIDPRVTFNMIPSLVASLTDLSPLIEVNHRVEG